MATNMDRDAIRDAYEDVRSNLTDTEWVVFKFESSEIVVAAKGSGFEDFRQQFLDDERAFGYIRIQMGDEMSKRCKFLFLTWIGCDVGVMQRAKMSTDKSIMKEVISNFAAELTAECEADMDLNYFMEVLQKAQGANYGTGIRNEEN
ncbi:hypothetical protein PVAND_012764 [Polypedilum vanderplanki]|uniref:Coactosin-like protein n=1 Tax=Polypedilum vanderplanki TaxID=319348 RepID=A0A9J6CNP5_POLVA|nr:hypothetical protein PVAND_012764 [Polypedilum vanderplanki]